MRIRELVLSSESSKWFSHDKEDKMEEVDNPETILQVGVYSQ
jgi:hypothetical protein